MGRRGDAAADGTAGGDPAGSDAADDGTAGDEPLDGPDTVAPGERPGRPDYEGLVSDASVGRWRTSLRGDELREVMRLCGFRLRELGYEV